jgi:hypothetical protein
MSISKEEILYYVGVGLFVLTILLLLYTIVNWTFSDSIIVAKNSSEVPPTGQGGEVPPMGQGGECDPGFTKQGNTCIKKCYEHSSLANLYQRPEQDISNKFAKYGVDDRWDNINSATDYCYMCPDGFELDKIDDNKKMYCTTRCPAGMMNNIKAQTCYKGYLLCPHGESVEACEMRACSPGYTKQTNHLSQVVCVPDGATCPPGMRNNDAYIGCWKDRKEAVISNVEDLYFLN